jgi:ribosomal protein L34E
MREHTKIATCSYCGNRQVLQLTARGGHELACGACGAPLHEMKWLKAPEPSQPKKKPSRPMPAPHGRPSYAKPNKRKKTKYKKRKPLWHKALEEAFDVIEDIFD